MMVLCCGILIELLNVEDEVVLMRIVGNCPSDAEPVFHEGSHVN